eukprot:5053669-Amphidinium_carterae.1
MTVPQANADVLLAGMKEAEDVLIQVNSPLCTTLPSAHRNGNPASICSPWDDFAIVAVYAYEIAHAGGRGRIG